jgi:hypothetical protein
MRAAYFDCFAGVAGDMIVGALLDAGADLEALRAELAKLRLDGCTVRAEKVRRAGLAGTKFHVQVLNQPADEQQSHPHRGLSDILALIDGAALPARAAQNAKAIFTRLGQAESQVHGVALEQVHFHEVGAVDSIVDIVASCLAIEMLGIQEVFCSPIAVGNGFVKMAHGVLPVPAPATALLLKGASLANPPAGEQPLGELATPTGVAVVTGLAKGCGGLPAMELEAVGYGAGSRDNPALPNLLRVMIGQTGGPASADAVVELSANLDDCTGQVLGWAVEALMEAGALDAWVSPIYMKKSRPAWMLSVLASPADAQRLERLIFTHTTTLGVRRRLMARSILHRRHETVQTPYGPIRVKVGSGADTEFTASPEYSDCAAAAAAHGVSVKEVLAAAMAAYRGRRA